MKPEESILVEAMEHPAAERAAFVNQACEGDFALRERLMALLRGYDGAGAQLELSPFAGAAGIVRAQNADVSREYATGTRIGRYKLLQRLGEGGCGVVFMAEQEEPVRRRVALKVIKLGMDTREVIARFEAERQALALMDHPNIAHVLDAGATENGRPFFVMELVHGVPITNHCDQYMLGNIERIHLFIQVCSAIQHAHQKGIIHRDLKPTNILVTLHDGVPVPKIIDFGIAKAMHGRLTDHTLFTAFEQFIGTPAYMSPEQMEMSGIDIDTRSDLYSLGVLLYELLTGRTPFDSRDLLQAGLDQMRRTIREKEPIKPSTRVSTLDLADGVAIAGKRGTDLAKLRSGLRGDVDWIVMRCLEKDRRRRYETASGLALDLQRYLRHEPITARPPSTAYILRKLVRRNQLAFGAAAAVLLALIAGLAFSAFALMRERAARQRADLEAARSAQVARLMQDMLAGVGPQVAVGRDTRLLRTILDQTVVRMNTQLSGQPEVEASLRETLGHVYRDLDEFSAAALMYERALQLRREAFGPEHVAVADLLHELGEIRIRQGRLGEAENLLRDALALRDKQLGVDHAATTSSRGALAHVRALAQSTRAESSDEPASVDDGDAIEEKPTVIRIATAGGMVGGKPLMLNALNIAYQKRALEQEFERDGIRIEWSSPSYYTVQETFVQGVPDFSSLGPIHTLVARATGLGYKLLMPAHGLDTPVGLVVRSDSPFRTVADLQGKRVGISKGTSSHLAFCRIIAKDGLQEADFNIVPIRGLAASDTAFAAGEVDARMIQIGEMANPDQLRNVRIISDFSSDPKRGNAGKLAVTAEFERRYPSVVQRVVTSLVKSAAWSCEERNRSAVLESWADTPERLAALRSASAGPLLKERMSPLMDDSFMAELRRDSDDAKRFGMIPADADMSFEGWVEPKYLKQALSDLRLERYWPERDADGKPKPANVTAR